MASAGAKTAARLIQRHGPIEQFPPAILGDNLEPALLFKKLATLRTDEPLFADVESLHWLGPTTSFAAMTDRLPAGLTSRIRALHP